MKGIPKWQTCSSPDIANFRKFAFTYWLKRQGGGEDITVTNALINSIISCSEEDIDIDDETTRVNYQTLLRNTMQQSGAGLKIIAFLEECQKSTPGFDFRILKNGTGTPICITWMTPHTRRDLIRFGTVLFLDAQKRQFNFWDYPYCAMTMVDSENIVCVGSETLYSDESHQGYKQMIEFTAEMEPAWDQSRVLIVFGDMVITKKLLRDAKMESALLRGDKWHLLNEVFPKADKFGSKWDSIRPQIKSMLESSNKDTWDSSYKQAISNLRGSSALIEKVRDIYDNPSYYAGYHLVQTVGNLGKKGDSHAEQNHGSVVAHRTMERRRREKDHNWKTEETGHDAMQQFRHPLECNLPIHCRELKMPSTLTTPRPSTLPSWSRQTGQRKGAAAYVVNRSTTATRAPG